MRSLPAFILAALAAAVLALPSTAAASPGMLIGAAEDAAKNPDPAVAKAKMDLALLAGFNAVRLTAIWAPGRTAPSAGELLGLQNAVAAADLDGIRVFLSVYHYGSSTTPRTPLARAQFAQFAASLATALPSVRDYIVGNEPNLNRFWMPQFNPNGSDAAAPAYEALLAQTYDALKAVSPTINVVGGSVSPRGGDDPRSTRQTHSPTTFIADLGAAYRASGRTKPIMDSFAFHPYQDNSSLPPSFAHPRSTTIALADYGKLVSLLGKAFDGTAQVGSKLPIVYDEFGVESQIPLTKRAAYQGLEPPTTRPVDEAKQGAYYAQALALAACQPTVSAFLIFHVSDESDLNRWQSGLFYADDTPKASLGPVRDAVATVRAGKVSCGGPAAGSIQSPQGGK